MAFIDVEIWDVTKEKKDLVELPDDAPVNRIIVVLVDRLNYPRYDPGGQILSYKLHHEATRKQLVDDQTLEQSGVKDGDILTLTPEIIAGGAQNREQVVRIDDPNSEDSDRFARFRLIQWWDQEKLQNAKVLVIGAGALGNENIKNLALLGVGNIFIADMDTIENTNLCRAILFREEDRGAKKSEVAARAMKSIYKDANIQWFCGDIVYDLGLGVYEWADLVIAGLDNRLARVSVNKNCWRTNTPWIDGGIEQLNGYAQVFVPPGGACYECTMSKTDWDILDARKRCWFLSKDDILMGRVPTTPTSASVIAGIQCQEAVKLLHGFEVLESKAYRFYGLTHNSRVINYERKKSCQCHGDIYSPIQKTHRSIRTTRIAEMLEEVKRELGSEAVIDFNNDILEAFECEACGKREQVFRSLGQVKEREAICPSCGSGRYPKTFHSVDGSEDFLDKTFADIGVPPFDIIIGREGMDEIFLEFDQDAQEVLGPLHKNQ